MKRNQKFKPKVAIVVIALSTILGGQSALASAVANSPSFAQQQQVNYKSSEVQIASAGDFTYSKEATEALNHLNAIRKKAGLQEVKLNPYLVKSAENHAKYSASNGSSSGHDEVKGNKYFTGTTPQARAEAVGADVFLAQELSEGISYHTSSVVDSINSLLDTAYHRTPLVNENLSELGVGVSGNHVVLVYSAMNNTSDTSVYPYDGQKDVPLGFYGFEDPNPLTQFGVSKSGYIISASVPYVIDTKKVDATIKDSKGEVIPYYSQFKLQWFLFPKTELKPNETYTVSLNYVVKNGPDEGKKINKTWSFTTKSGGTTTPPTTTPPTKPVDPTNPTNPTKPPVTTGKYNKDNVGVEINGKFVTLNPKAKIVDGSTFIPLRGVFEELNSQLLWNGKEQSVTITRGTTKVKLTIGSKIAYIDGTKVTLSSAPFTIDGSTYVPLRFASEAIGADVKWDQANYVAKITTE
ncbi:Cysteine-rich secretory protein family protein [Paenibacillus sp. 1_12]|uniref:stalk domain-containing protein n=1 Tax=Paenibacillus sp. 1_12 TaxID=1566278 RepID=UPI0008F12CA3|nr:stalk domain-containing protein [Paenibacillus sp. 1_12]SFM42353.1 Cysteine-rich secretory protein family protein [Paenibacillus sp. 1_12]